MDMEEIFNIIIGMQSMRAFNKLTTLKYTEVTILYFRVAYFKFNEMERFW